MTVPSFEPWMVQALLPEILLLVLALLVLLVDAIWHGRSRTWLGWFTAIGLVAIAGGRRLLQPAARGAGHDLRRHAAR